MREPYICLYCDQRSTRWWNLKIHMKRKHGEYSPGLSGRYTANNHAAYSKGIQLGHATIADSVGDFQPRYLPQQIPPQISNFANPLYGPQHTMDNQSSLSQDKTVKIGELKRLAYRYPQYLPNPDAIIRLAIFNSINGDNQLLDQTLEQFLTLDSLAKLYVGAS